MSRSGIGSLRTASVTRPGIAARTATLLLTAFCLLATALVAPPAEATVRAFVSTRVVESPDWAATTWHDAWDYSNPSDVNFNRGPSNYLTSPALGGGMMSFYSRTGSFVSQLFPGIAGSVARDRDGYLPANQIDTAYYTRLHMHAYASARTNIGMDWFTPSFGGKPITLYPGWNDYDVDLTTGQFGGLSAWRGHAIGLRLQVTGSAHIAVDFIRVYHPASTVTWRSPDGSAATLMWASSSTRAAGAASDHGVVVGATAGGSTTSGSTVRTTDVSGYPAGTVFYVLAAGGRYLGDALGLTSRPSVVVDSPSAQGCNDYAGSLHQSWTMRSPSATRAIGDATAISWAGGYLSATNAAPRENDPYVLPNMFGHTISTRAFHYVTVTYGYDGGFGLGGTPGGGTVMRILYQGAGMSSYGVSLPLVTWPGVHAITIDMAGNVVDPAALPSQRYAWRSVAAIGQLRIDPNEDPGARRWHLMSVHVAGDCVTSTTMGVTFHDNAYTGGSTTTLLAVGYGHTYTVGRVAEHGGYNTATANVAGVPHGTYQLVLQTTNGAATTNSAAGVPLVVG